MFDEHPAIFNLRQALWALRGERMRFLAGSSKDRRDAKATDVGNAAAFLMGVCRRFGIECPTVHEVVKSPYWEISHIDNRDALDEELERIASALPKRKKAATAEQPKGGGGAEQGNGGIKVTKAESNFKAREFLLKNPRATVRQLAEGIGCSTGLVSNLPAWKAVMEQRKKGRLPKRTSVVSLTPKMKQLTGNEDDPLDKLIEEQQADAEPSPLQDDMPGHVEGMPRRAKVYRSRGR